MSLSIVNIASYKFFDFPDFESFREPLREQCEALQLRGSILLSPEGINLFLAGATDAITAIEAYLTADPRMESLDFKVSYSEYLPFNRMLVKLKKEIIPLGDMTLRPHEKTAPYVKPKELKKWLDEGREVVMLDTRNDYEIRVGTFENAIDPGLKEFRVFGEKIRPLKEDLKDKTVVTFCTGGIRCEKAAELMEREGFNHVYQLEGGILKYFEECGAAHYDGECFVFDQRVAVDAELKETQTTQCYACQEPLSPEQQQQPEYVIGVSCPYCAHKHTDASNCDSNRDALK